MGQQAPNLSCPSPADPFPGGKIRLFFFFAIFFIIILFFSLFCSALNLGSQASCTSPVAKQRALLAKDLEQDLFFFFFFAAEFWQRNPSGFKEPSICLIPERLGSSGLAQKVQRWGKWGKKEKNIGQEITVCSSLGFPASCPSFLGIIM